MEKTTQEKQFIKMMIPLIIIAAAICLFRSGYQAGHWLHALLHK